MKAPTSINYLTSKPNNNNEINIKKEFLIKTDNISYKLKIYSNNKYMIFKIEKSNDLMLYYYYNNYEHNQIINILKLNDKLYDNFEKIIELINDANLNKKISIFKKNDESIDLRIELPIGFKVYNCSLILKRKEFEINEKFEVIMNGVRNDNFNNEYKMIKKKIINIKQSTEKKFNENKKLNNSLNEKIENNKKELEKNKIKIKLLKKEIDNLKKKIEELINSIEKMKDLKDEKNLKNIIEDKDKKIKEITLEIDNIKEKYDKFYKDKIKDIIVYYEQIISPSEIKKKINGLDYENFKNNIFNYDNKANKLTKNNEYIIIRNNEIEIKKTNFIKNKDILKQIKEINIHLFNNFNINQNENKISRLKKDGKNYILSELEFINNKCNKCNKISSENNYKCVLCENYFICNNCYKVKSKFHEHDFFKIKYPSEINKQMKNTKKNNISYISLINKFNEILNDIFFDKDGNLSTKEIKDFSKFNLNQIYIDMKAKNESVFNYFSNYKMNIINQKQLKKINEEDQNKIYNKIMSLVNKLSEIEERFNK